MEGVDEQKGEESVVIYICVRRRRRRRRRLVGRDVRKPYRMGATPHEATKLTRQNPHDKLAFKLLRKQDATDSRIGQCIYWPGWLVWSVVWAHLAVVILARLEGKANRQAKNSDLLRRGLFSSSSQKHGSSPVGIVLFPSYAGDADTDADDAQPVICHLLVLGPSIRVPLGRG